MTDNVILEDQGNTIVKPTAKLMQKWGGVASFLLAGSFIVAPFIYLTGNLRDPFGELAYNLADLLYGPVWGASLVTAVYALRERIGEHAPRRMTLALLIAILAAAMSVITAVLRSTNRQYHLMHPELSLDMSSTVLTAWTTLVSGVTAAGRHFMGWSLLLLGSAGWTTRRLPRTLSALYLVGGAMSMFAYVLPILDSTAVALGVIWAIWQGILLMDKKPV